MLNKEHPEVWQETELGEDISPILATQGHCQIRTSLVSQHVLVISQKLVDLHLMGLDCFINEMNTSISSTVRLVISSHSLRRNPLQHGVPVVKVHMCEAV